ncbi:MAG TPA: hypothetical protein VJQ47_12415 [Steroidobacteraceae bacterium]|nr:hypothetical protein [Steroidobacteraceae bacterium]
MKLNRKLTVVLVAAAAVGTGGAVALAAADSAPTTAAAPPAPGRHWHGRHHGLLVGSLLRATRQLNLTSDQQQSIEQLLQTAGSQEQAARAAAGVDWTVLANPGDPNYATALQNAKSLASARLDRESTLQSQIYNVLTKPQRDQLPQVLANMKATMQQRRAEWQQRHATRTPAPAAGSN